MNPIFNRWMLLFVALLTLVGALFWRDAAEHSTDSVTSLMANGEGPAALSDADLATATGFYLEGSFDPASPGALPDIDIAATGRGAFAVTTRLNDVVAHGRYPTLFVTMNTTDGKPLRTAVFSPARYQHAAAAADGPILLAIVARPGETRMRVRASYSEPRALR